MGEELVNEVAVQLLEGTIPDKWKAMRVVLIPKLGRDLTVTKSWRPINLINCIGKLGEKVVADHLQDADLLHHHQFGAVKGRSALEVVFQAVVTARRCMDGGGDAAWGFWDVKRGFQNVTKKEVIERMGLTKEGRRWKKWITSFMGERSFAVSWDGKDRGVGQTNVGVPQGSPLSPILFLIWMAPILEEMERRIRWKVGVDIELPSDLDDIHLGIYDHGTRGAGIQDLDGEGEAIGELLARADRVLKEVALEKGLPLEDSKEEKLILRKRGRKKRKRNKEMGRVKWLGVILDEDLEFDIHWKGRVGMAKKMLGALNGVDNSQWGISPNSWRSAYTRMVRSIATWGAEIGWRGQDQWRHEMTKLQYAVLRKATGAITGARMENVSRIGGV